MYKNKIVILLVTVLLANLLLAPGVEAKKCRFKIGPGYKFSKNYNLTLVIDNATEPDITVDYIMKILDGPVIVPANSYRALIKRPFSSLKQTTFLIFERSEEGTTVPGAKFSFQVPYEFESEIGKTIQTIQFDCTADTGLCFGCCSFNGTCTSTYTIAGKTGQFTSIGTVVGTPR